MTRDMFIDAIKAEQRRIQRFIDLSPASGIERGHLYIQRQNGNLYGFERWKKSGEPPKKIYLGLPDSDAVRELFSVRFQAQRMGHLKHNQKLLEKLERQYEAYDFESVVAELPKAYQAVAFGDCFDESYEEVWKWAHEDYPKNTYPFSDAEIYAKDGTRVRSKGECIWYNLLLERGIPFRYDSEIHFVDKNGDTKIRCPDFLIKCLDGTMIIIEHLGRMGDHSYAMDFGDTCYWYFQEGFVLGKNFFVTSDEPNYGTDSRMIEKLVDRIEKMFFGY